jgi:Trypsin-like peptidase domain
MAQIPEFVGLLLLGEDEEFRGSTFPISEAHGLYLGAGHTIPPDREDELRIAIQNTSGRLVVTKVLDVEVLEGQPDVVVLQAEDGSPPYLPLAAEPAFIWESAAAAGYPDGDMREAESGTIPGIRGLTGTVTRKVEAGDELGVKGPAYEMSFAIPAGMSGGPVLSMRLGYPFGLIGVCLGNVSATSYVSGEVVEKTGEGQQIIRQERG